uniref:Conserved secreted protein n=1 Tax=Elaeophora elaphi TaxID=1147741 RepID=A0A0R3S4Q2_9BILA
MISVTLFARIAVIVTLTANINALVCYENDESGKIYEISNESWDYCVFIPDSDEARVFGVGPEADWTKVYDDAFGKSDKIYQVLSVCLLEKYDFGQLYPKSILNLSGSVEFIFRCICSYDRCNSATTFSSYLKAIKLDNASSSAED